MFRNDQQIARAARVLCGRLPRLRDAWTEEGPSSEALALMEANGGPLSSGERAMLLAAFTFWNGARDEKTGQGRLAFVDVLDALDGEHMRCLAELMIAAADGADAVDAWLRTWQLRSVR